MRIFSRAETPRHQQLKYRNRREDNTKEHSDGHVPAQLFSVRVNETCKTSGCVTKWAAFSMLVIAVSLVAGMLMSNAVSPRRRLPGEARTSSS